MTQEERFWPKVLRTEGCWLWMAAKTTRGYGSMTKGPWKGGTMAAHRFSYRLHKGPIPAGLHVLHRCDVPSCVNPSHLWLGTDADNARDKTEKGRQLYGERHPATKLSDADVLEIRRLYANGVTQSSIAARFGIHQGTVSQICSGKRRHLVVS